MPNLDSFGITEEYPYTENLFIYSMNKPKLIFQGYKGSYYYQQYGYAEFSCGVMENSKGKKEFKRAFLHVSGNNMYRMKIEKVLEREELSCICLCSTLEGDYEQVPVHFVFSDCLPSILPGDVVYFQGVLFLVHGYIRETIEEAEKAIGFPEIKRMGSFLHLADGFSFPLLDKKEKPVLFLSSISDYYMLPGIPAIGDEAPKPVYAATINTKFGNATLIIPPFVIEENKEQIEELKKGKEMYVAGFYEMSGDVDIDEYQDGAIFDEEHFLRLFREALELRDYSRIESYIAEDCTYLGWKNKQLKGRKEILEKFLAVDKAQKASPENYQHFYLGTITGIVDADKAEFSIGKRCLLSTREQDRSAVICIGFIEINDNNKISAIKFIYENIYKFKADIPETNPNQEINCKLLKTEKTAEEWQAFLLKWFEGEQTDQVKFYGGLEPEAKLVLFGKEYYGKEEVWEKTKVFMTEKKPKENNIDVVVNVSERGRIVLISISQNN